MANDGRSGPRICFSSGPRRDVPFAAKKKLVADDATSRMDKLQKGTAPCLGRGPFVCLPTSLGACLEQYLDLEAKKPKSRFLVEAMRVA